MAMARGDVADRRMSALWISLTGGDQPKRAAISALLLFHLLVIVSGAIPTDFFLVKVLHAKGLLTALTKTLAPYASTTGLQVGWSMFAPNPSRDNTYIDAEITYRDGRKRIWSFPQMQELGYVERYMQERYRKFAAERLWVHKNAALCPDAARYIARLNADRSNPPATVKLVHYRYVIPWPPPPPGDTPPPERLERDVFFAYTVQAGDLP
jgi:hypothetical protein